jgi:XTP/dITP diphosphohydrolase
MRFFVIFDPMKQLLFSTGNSTKISMARRACEAYRIQVIQRNLEIDEIQGEDSTKIVFDKVEKAYSLVGQPVVVSDDTWAIPGLKGFPASYMKSINFWFTPRDFINLTEKLRDRSIFLISYLAYKDEKQVKIFQQKREGILLNEPKGESGVACDKVISMLDDDGLSISEVYDKHLDRSERDVVKTWHELAEWFARQ